MAEESGPPAVATDSAPSEAKKTAPVEDILEWPRCAFCGALTLHESSRGGFRERWLRWGSAAIYRCDGCNRRFAFAPLAHFKVSPNPPTGKAPLTVDFNACLTSDPNGDAIVFTFDVGDGPYESGHCRHEHTYRTAGTYQAKICVNDGFAGHADQCQSYSVSVN